MSWTAWVAASRTSVPVDAADPAALIDEELTGGDGDARSAAVITFDRHSAPDSPARADVSDTRADAKY